MNSTWSKRVLQHRVFPVAEGRHRAARRTAGGQLDRRVDPLHHLRRLGGDAAVFLRGLRLHLPRPIHLVAEAPELYAMRLLPAVRAAEIGQRGAAGMVAVLHQRPRRIAAARAEVHRQHRLDVGGAAPVDEFVGAEPVRLGGHPGQVEPARPLLDRADAILPIVAGDEIAAGIAHDGRRQFAHQRQHVAAEAVLIGGRMAGLEDAAIDAAAEVLDEGTEQAAIRGADHVVGAKLDGDCAHRVLLSRRRRRTAPRS